MTSTLQPSGSPQSLSTNNPVGFALKFTEPKSYPISHHLEALAMTKPTFHSRDFLLNKDFRGLFLADH